MIFYMLTKMSTIHKLNGFQHLGNSVVKHGWNALTADKRIPRYKFKPHLQQSNVQTAVQHQKLMKIVMSFMGVSTWKVEPPHPCDGFHRDSSSLHCPAELTC
jgi:hypothetical protein